MAAELFCPTHGPYDSAYGSCPYCARSLNQPQAPTPLDADELPTGLGAGHSAGNRQDLDEMPTDIGYGPGAVGDDEAPTELGNERPAKSKRRKEAPDLDEIQPTELGSAGRRKKAGKIEDETVLEFSEGEEGFLGILWAKEGDRRGLIFKVTDECVIGRTDGDIVLDDAKVSNPHAKIMKEDDHFVIWDFGSRNGMRPMTANRFG